MRKVAILSLSLIVVAAFAAPVADAAPPPGGLNAVSCLGNPTEAPLLGCAADSASIAALHDIALSPDGKQLYAVGGSQGDAIPGRLLTFARNADTGALALTGCIGPAVAGCTADSHLGFSNALALSPDGADLYVADYNGVVRYRRAADGGLTFAECATSSVVSGCDLAPGVAAASGVAVSSNGESVYVTGYIDDAVVALSRDTGSGDLSWLGCRASTGGNPLCTAMAGGGLDAATDVVVSPNATRVYVSGRNGNSVVTLDRAPSGAISAPRVLADDYLEGGQALAVAPEGNALYAGLFDGHGLTALGLDSATGDPSLLGCFMPEATFFCAASPGVDTVFGFDFSPGGDVLYAASRNGGSVSAFRRGPNGALSLIACTHAPEVPAEGCGETAGGVASAQGVAASADGRFVYVAGGATVATLRPEPTAPVPPTPDVKPKPLSLEILTERARLTKHGKLKVKLRCVSSPTGRCSGRLATRSVKKLERRLKSGKIVKRYLKLGARSFSIAPGKTKTVTIAVPNAARRVVDAKGSLRIRLSATAKRPAGKPRGFTRRITLRASS